MGVGPGALSSAESGKGASAGFPLSDLQRRRAQPTFSLRLARKPCVCSHGEPSASAARLTWPHISATSSGRLLVLNAAATCCCQATAARVLYPGLVGHSVNGCTGRRLWVVSLRDFRSSAPPRSRKRRTTPASPVNNDAVPAKDPLHQHENGRDRQHSVPAQSPTRRPRR